MYLSVAVQNLSLKSTILIVDACAPFDQLFPTLLSVADAGK